MFQPAQKTETATVKRPGQKARRVRITSTWRTYDELRAIQRRMSQEARENGVVGNKNRR